MERLAGEPKHSSFVSKKDGYDRILVTEKY